MLTKLDAKWTQGEWLNFKDEGPVSPGSKTNKFSVWDRQGGIVLGYVKWFVQWRQYCFFPLNAVFDKKCLREVADFCEQTTQSHRENR
jgi:hypothetical protein